MGGWVDVVSDIQTGVAKGASKIENIFSCARK